MIENGANFVFKESTSSSVDELKKKKKTNIVVCPFSVM